jgi:hypothetical protein
MDVGKHTTTGVGERSSAVSTEIINCIGDFVRLSFCSVANSDLIDTMKMDALWHPFLKYHFGTAAHFMKPAILKWAHLIVT